MRKNYNSMKSYLKKTTTKKLLVHTMVFLFLVSVFLGSYVGVLAQGTSIADVCGQSSSAANACTFKDIGPLVKGVLGYVVTIGIPLLFIFVAYRFLMAWFALQQGNAGAYKDALKKAGNAILGFLIIVILIGGGLYTVLAFFGVNPTYLEILNLFSSGGLFTSVYAQVTELPNPTTINNLYDFILNALRLFMKFLIYPGLIVVWVWTGFSFIAAQGAPDALIKAKKWLVGAFVSTLIIMVLQGFLLALRTSALKIMGSSSSSQVSQSGK